MRRLTTPEVDSAIASKIMDLFARDDAWRGIGRIMRAASVGVNRSAVRTALEELVRIRFLRFNEQSRKYRLAAYRSPREGGAESNKAAQATDDFIWPSAPGATISENNAINEYGVTHDDLRDAVKARKLHSMINYAHGNPYNKLVRKEVEALVREKRGSKSVDEGKMKRELAEITRELRSLKKRIGVLERRRAELEARLRD